MEFIMGIVGKDFTLIASDCSVKRSIVNMKNDNDKIYHVNTNVLMGTAGDVCDSMKFASFVERNIKLKNYISGYSLGFDACASFTRKLLADSLRSRDRYQVNVLMGGFDDKGAGLYYMDYLGSSFKTNYSAHGYGAYFTLGLLDKYYKKDMTVDEALNLVQMCMNELATRFIINIEKLAVKCVNKDGVNKLKDIKMVQIGA